MINYLRSKLTLFSQTLLKSAYDKGYQQALIDLKTTQFHKNGWEVLTEDKRRYRIVLGKLCEVEDKPLPDITVKELLKRVGLTPHEASVGFDWEDTLYLYIYNNKKVTAPKTFHGYKVKVLSMKGGPQPA